MSKSKSTKNPVDDISGKIQTTIQMVKRAAADTNVLICGTPFLDDSGDKDVPFETLNAIVDTVDPKITIMVVSACTTECRVVARMAGTDHGSPALGTKEWVEECGLQVLGTESPTESPNTCCVLPSDSSLKSRDVIISSAFASLRKHKVPIDGDDEEDRLYDFENV